MFVQKSHSHNEIELIEVVSGNGIVIKNDTTFELKSRHIYFIDARNVHIVYPQSENCDDYIRNKIVIDADSFEDFCKGIGILDFVEPLFELGPISTEYNAEVDLLYKKICELMNSDDAALTGFAHGGIVQLLEWAYSHSRSVDSGSQVETIQTILSIIADKKGQTSLEEISRELHMNKFYVSHFFKDKTGRNISEYIADKLYENAIKMLKEEQLSVEDVAFECGFSAAASFTRFFKNKSGITPSQFRKNQKN